MLRRQGSTLRRACLLGMHPSDVLSLNFHPNLNLMAFQSVKGRPAWETAGWRVAAGMYFYK